MKITRTSQEDVPALLKLIEESGLPQQGLTDHLETTLVARDGETIVGSAALELYGSAALLRSVAVAAELRGSGLGRHLTEAALDLARRHNVARVYLLTETAADFFPRFGFQPIARDQVDNAIHQSVEWGEVCPVSARVMVLAL